MTDLDRFSAYPLPHPSDAFQKQQTRAEHEREEESRRRPGQIDFDRLLRSEPVLTRTLEHERVPEGRLPCLISETPAPAPQYRPYEGTSRCMRYITCWNGFVVVREVRDRAEAESIHATLEKLLLGAGK